MMVYTRPVLYDLKSKEWKKRYVEFRKGYLVVYSGVKENQEPLAIIPLFCQSIEEMEREKSRSVLVLRFGVQLQFNMRVQFETIEDFELFKNYCKPFPALLDAFLPTQQRGKIRKSLISSPSGFVLPTSTSQASLMSSTTSLLSTNSVNSANSANSAVTANVSPPSAPNSTHSSGSTNVVLSADNVNHSNS